MTYIYGIGKATAEKIVAEAGINPDTRVRDLTEEEVQKLREIVGKLKVEGDLRREISLNIKRLSEIGCYRGAANDFAFFTNWLYRSSYFHCLYPPYRK